jgi:myosin heavy subunit
VPWQHIEYQDNGPVLDLIRAKRDGILTLLDEECRLQQGSPQTFVTKLTNAHGKSELLSIPKMARGKDVAPSFCVVHYAGKVEYDTALFLQKNTDPLHPELGTRAHPPCAASRPASRRACVMRVRL